MKIIYEIGTVLDIEYHKDIFDKIYDKLINKNVSTTRKEWLIRNVKYIYASSPKEAIEKYKMIFLKTYNSLSGWFDWYEYSKGITVNSINNSKFKIINQEVTLISANVHPKNIKSLKNSMSACDFRNWWHDYNNDNRKENLE